MNVAYVAGPYAARTAHDIDENIRRAREVAVELWRQGWAVICPHLNTAHFDGAVYPDDLDADRRVWLRGDLELIGLLRPGRDVVVTENGITRWDCSTGTLREVAEATNRGVSVYHWPEDRATLATLARPAIVLPDPSDGPDD